jgi:hypothetical protein
MPSFESIKTTLILEFKTVKDAYHKFLECKHSSPPSSALVHSSKIELTDALDEWNLLFLTLTDCITSDDKNQLQLLFTKKVNKILSDLS